MQVNKPFKDATKYSISVLDAVSKHKIVYNPFVPLIYKQDIRVSPDMYPQKPPDRSQLYRYLNPPEENPWLGGVPIGKILVETEKKQFKLIAKQFKHKLVSQIYNPPLHLTYKWDELGGETNAMEKVLKDQKDFNDKHGVWRNMYRIRYCELTDIFFLQVRVNHMFPLGVFECDIGDVDKIFEEPWYLHHVKFLDQFTENMIRYQIVRRDREDMKKKGMSIVKFLLDKGSWRHYDNNLLNCRRSNFVPDEKRIRLMENSKDK